jgi:hypothetical protein
MTRYDILIVLAMMSTIVFTNISNIVLIAKDSSYKLKNGYFILKEVTRHNKK